ncbi:MAG: Cytochrome c1 heme lyase [Cirrosporium novae-zelandiae]|nr:MAG: Cytochrome c1 heme lyase [Cirrosporium novae-zelandiae]
MGNQPSKPPSSTSTSSPSSISACPVDEKARAAWLEKSAQTQTQNQNQTQNRLPPTHPPLPPTADPSSPQACPVDSNARATWLSQAQSHPLPATIRTPQTPSQLSHHRQISSIPRADASPDTETPSPQSQTSASHASRSPNSETHLPTTSPSGNWMYPSESQFFQALLRKSQPTSPSDMSTIVPIHNAVNERAWHLIKTWENPYTSASCPLGPRLVSFSGDSSKRSPRARLYGLLGYKEPFDRHDWIVDRCGTRVEYVIDFYEGREMHGGKGGLNFYLDVRPKLNSWEGWRMRAARVVGWTGDQENK